MTKLELGQPNLPFTDERLREAEQYVMELPPPRKPPDEVLRTAEAQVCIGDCNICIHCDNNGNGKR